MISIIQDDTIRLLRQCNAGVKMGVASIEETLPYVKSARLSDLLSDCMRAHERLGDETRRMLNEYGDAGKQPSPVAKGMSWIKTNLTMTLDKDDRTAADLMTDGGAMGAKSLSRYLNQYAAAEERAKDIAKKLIAIEDGLTSDLRPYL